MNDPLAYAVEREVAAPVAAVWTAWTDADALRRWYHPVGLGIVPGSVVSDATVGGWWTVGVDVPEHGLQAFFYGRYTEVSPMARLAHTMMYTTSPVEFAARDESVPSHLVVVDIEDRGERSWVRFAQYGEMPAEQAAQAQAGMESYLDSLQGFLAGG